MVSAEFARTAPAWVSDANPDRRIEYPTRLGYTEVESLRQNLNTFRIRMAMTV